MLITMNQIRRDFLALRGESPDLLPLLEEGEQSAVLTLDDLLRTRLMECAVRATLDTDPLFLDEIEDYTATIDWRPSGAGRLRLPANYLKFHSLLMPDWAEPVREPEPKESLRGKLRGNAPKWMICPHRPMVAEGRDTRGPFLLIYGSEREYDRPEECLYIPRPAMEGDALRISAAAYPQMLVYLNSKNQESNNKQ